MRRYLIPVLALAACSTPISREVASSGGARRAHPKWSPVQDPHPPAGRDNKGGGARLISPAPQKPYLTELRSEEDFDQLAVLGDGLVRGGHAVKFLIDKRDPNRPQIYFLNANLDGEATKYHFTFATEILRIPIDQDSFERSSYWATTLAARKFIPGTLQVYTQGSGKPFIGLQFYPQDVIREDAILYAAKVVKESISIPDRPLNFVSYGVQQTVGSVEAELSRLDIQNLSVDEVLGSMTYLPMNTGEAWGILAVFPKNADEISPLHIPVFDELPLDLAVTAGTMTFSVQNPGSHINLKSKERGTPNMVLHDREAIEKLRREFDGKPVHLTVGEETYTVRPATMAKVEAEYRKKIPSQWVVNRPGSVRRIQFFDEMCAQNGPARDCLNDDLSRSFGSKAARLAFIGHPDVLGSRWAKSAGFDYSLTPDGFGVPLAFYDAVVSQAANPNLHAMIQSFIAEEMGLKLSAARREQLLKAIREEFLRAKIPTAVWTPYAAAAKKFLARIEAENPELRSKKKIKVKIRSSGSAEDIEGFNGAGLHESYGANLRLDSDPNAPCRLVENTEGVVTKADVEPETIACAMKGVYASLWNKRAVEERSFRRFDHRSVGMGLAVNASYSLLKDRDLDETANSVIITRVINSGVYGYTVTSNVGENLVTNPLPNTQPEVAVMNFLALNEKPSTSFLQRAKPLPNEPVRTQPVYSDRFRAQIVRVIQQLELAYCEGKSDYYPGGFGKDCEFAVVDKDKPRALDVEIKVLGNERRIVLKQMREFAGK